MGFEFLKKLPTPEEIRNQYPIDADIKGLKEKRDQEDEDGHLDGVDQGRAHDRPQAVAVVVVGVLVGAAHRASEANVTLEVARPRHNVSRVLALLGGGAELNVRDAQ